MKDTFLLWAFWQTKTGKVIFSCIGIFLLIYVLKWKVLIAIPVTVVLYYLVKLENESNRKKEMKKLDEEYQRWHRLAEEQEKERKRLEKKFMEDI